MAKKVSFDNLPAMVEKVLEILTAEGSEHTAIPEILQRLTLLEKRNDNIERLLSPNRPTMDKQTVMRVLKIRPKPLSELENSGLLLSHSEGRRTVYYEDEVVRFYMNTGWKAAVEAASKAETAEPAPTKSASAKSASDEPAPADDGRLIGIAAAAEMIGRTKLTVYRLTSQKKIPFVRTGNKIYFDVEELKQYLNDRDVYKPKPQNDGAGEQGNVDVGTETGKFVDIHGASRILGRTPGAIRQHLSTIEHEKVGNKLFFDPRVLVKWAKEHPARPRKKNSKHNETETSQKPVESGQEG